MRISKRKKKLRNRSRPAKCRMQGPGAMRADMRMIRYVEEDL
jgi:hypothetical protein